MLNVLTWCTFLLSSLYFYNSLLHVLSFSLRESHRKHMKNVSLLLEVLLPLYSKAERIVGELSSPKCSLLCYDSAAR